MGSFRLIKEMSVNVSGSFCVEFLWGLCVRTEGDSKDHQCDNLRTVCAIDWHP